MIGAVGQNRVQRRNVDSDVRGNCVGAAGVKLLERVGRVTGEHHVTACVIDTDHGQVTGGVPGVSTAKSARRR